MKFVGPLVVLAVLAAACSDGKLDLREPTPDGGSTGGAAGAAGSVDAGQDAGDAGGCTSSAQCAGEHPFCDLNSGICVDCLNSSHCSPGQACNPLTYRCAKACSGDPDCASIDKVCDTTLGVCVQCRNDNDCAGGEPYCVPGGICEECRNDADCTEPGTPYCPKGRYECSQCLVTAHCKSGQVCSTKDYECHDG